LLQNSLGGNSKTLMIMHLNPRKLFANESFNTLRFAQKVNSTNIGTAQKVSFNSYLLILTLFISFRSANKLNLRFHLTTNLLHLTFKPILVFTELPHFHIPTLLEKIKFADT